MPELPEVETYVRELEPELVGRMVTAAQVFWPRTIATPTPAEFIQQMVGQRFARFDRRGKYMLLGLASGSTLLVHLRMTGHLLIQASGVARDKHTHVTFALDDGRQLHYQDARKFGRLWLVAEPESVLHKLGPEPLSEHFTVAGFAQRLAGRATSIKSLLLDQQVVAGVGNIYADEALFLAGIHPARPGGAVDEAELTHLQQRVREVLTAAIAHKGSSLGQSSIQNYLRPSGEPGGFQAEHKVYGRTGQPCVCCATAIQRIVLAQRSAHFCPVCQR